MNMCVPRINFLTLYNIHMFHVPLKSLSAIREFRPNLSSSQAKRHLEVCAFFMSSTADAKLPSVLPVCRPTQCGTKLLI
jgi:hypothetical protein